MKYCITDRASFQMSSLRGENVVNELQIFNSSKFGDIRTVDVDGKVYFVAKDVATALGYSNTKDAILRHCKGVVKRDLLTKGGKQLMNVIPEGDLYRLVANSELPAAEEFESWIFDEVIPTIRKTGSYTLPKQQSLEPLYTPAVRTYQGQRVVTIKDISLATKQPEGSITYWINTKCRKATDFLLLRGAALQTFKSENGLQGYLASRLYVVFESGFRKICKMLGILPEKTGCFPVSQPSAVTTTLKQELRTDVPDNFSIQKALLRVRKSMIALDVLMEEYNDYNLEGYHDKVKDVLSAIAANIFCDVTRLLRKSPHMIEKAI